MKCEHGMSILKCKVCIVGGLIKCQEVVDKISKDKLKEKSCFVTAFIEPGPCNSSFTGATGGIVSTSAFGYNPSSTNLIGTFTLDQLTSGSPTSILCNPLPISGNGLQLGTCRSPGWGLAVERDTIVGTYAYIQSPKCCSGCYLFDLSASVTLTGIVGSLSISLDVLGLPIITVTDGIETSLAFTFDLSLCEVKQNVQCTSRNITIQKRTLTKLLDAPCASTTFSPPSTFDLTLLTLQIPLISLIPIPIPLPIPSLVGGIHPINLSTSGIVCLNDCTKLVPCITIRGVQSTQQISILGISVSLISGPFNLRVTCLSLNLKKIEGNNNCGNCDDCESCNLSKNRSNSCNTCR